MKMSWKSENFFHVKQSIKFFFGFDKMLLTIQAWIQHLKEVSQTDEIVVFPFISNSDIF